MIELFPQAVDEVKDSIDLWYAFIVGIPATIAAVATLWGQRRAKERWTRQERVSDEISKRWDKQERVSGEIHHEVRNDHATNLRDDLTDLAVVMREGFSSTRKDIQLLREELIHERHERIEGDKR